MIPIEDLTDVTLAIEDTDEDDEDDEEDLTDVTLVSDDRWKLGKPSNRIFGKIWDFGPTEGGGACQSQIFIQFFQNKLDYGKWPEM